MHNQQDIRIEENQMRIGIPKALLYYYYYPFWKELFSQLGAEIVLSDDTNGKIISEGAAVTVTELCVPIKIFNGHVMDLKEKNVDYIFIPKFHRRGPEWYCPKFVGIEEIVKYSVDMDKSKFIVVDYITKTDDLGDFKAHLPLCDALGVSKSALKEALKKASAKQKECRKLCESGYTVAEAYDILDGKQPPKKNENPILTIGLMGYVNNIYDNFVSMNIIKKLREMDVDVITFDMIPEDKIEKKKKIKQPFWVFARKIYNASAYILENNMADGIIHLTAFGCGPDSIIGKLMEVDCEEKEIPFMTLRVDEHTGESHVQTRIEAFIDMLKRSRKNEVKS